MDYSCPHCRENIKSKTKIRFYRSKKRFLNSSFFRYCEVCNKIITENEHVISMRLRILNIFFFMLYGWMWRSLARLGFNHDGIDILITIPVFLVNLAIIKYFMSKIPDDWLYWKKSEIAPTGIAEDTT